MMNRVRGNHFLRGVLLAALGLAAVIAVPVEAAEEKPVVDEVGQTLSNLDLADGLINYGRSTKTPEALVTAALILHRNPTEPIKIEGEEKPDTSLSPKALLEEARAMRKDDKALAGVIESALDTIKEAPRGGAAPVSVAKGKASHGKPLKFKQKIFKKLAKGQKHQGHKIKATRHLPPNDSPALKKKRLRHHLQLIVKDPTGKVVATVKAPAGADTVEAVVPPPADPSGDAGEYTTEVHIVANTPADAAAESGDPTPPQDVSVSSGASGAAPDAAPSPR